MNKIGLKIFCKDDLLNADNFARIENFLLKHGREIIWSNLYGAGMYYRIYNVSVIYSYLGFGREQPAAHELSRPFLFIDLFPPGNQAQHSARCDAEFTFEIKVGEGDELQIQDLTRWYHEREVTGELTEQNAHRAFQVLLEQAGHDELMEYAGPSGET